MGKNAGVALPLYLTSPGALAGAAVGGRADLDGAEARHAVAVRRTAVGELVQLADGEGALVVGPVIAAAPDRLTIRVDEVHHLEEPSPRFVLVQALAKNDRDDQAIEAATELGVDEVIPWQSERCIVQWRGERGEKAHRKWDQILLAATKQSRRARRPALAPLLTTTGLAQRVERVVREGGTAYVLHEEASTPLAGADLPTAGDVLVIVGPEGGIAPGEVEALTRAGALPVRLGSTVLRSSSAGPAALAVLNAQARWR